MSDVDRRLLDALRDVAKELRDIRLVLEVWQTAGFRPLATGGVVSPEVVARLGERSCVGVTCWGEAHQQPVMLGGLNLSLPLCPTDLRTVRLMANKQHTLRVVGVPAEED